MAAHAVAEVHDTAERDAPVGLGVGVIAHALPVQASTNVTAGVPSSGLS
jgi:hypothetical protein